MFIINKSQKGIGLVEVIAALGISVIVLTSLVSLSLFTLRSSLTSKLLLEGTKVANRELELVRASRDAAAEWENGADGFLDTVMNCTDADNACHMNFTSGISVGPDSATSGSGAETVTRYFIATRTDGSQLQTGDQIVRVSVIVSWVIGSDTKYSRVYTDLTNWENK